MPQRFVRLGVVCCVSVAVGLGFAYWFRAVDRLQETASTNAAMNFDDREFGGGNSFVADKRALYQARALIPEDSKYRVLMGAEVEGATEFTALSIREFARYFLMPRRPAADARWVICHGCDRSALGDSVDVEWDNGGGISILQLPS